VAKKQKSKDAQVAKTGRVKTSVILDASAYRTLGAAALWENKDNSAMMQMLIDTYLSDYAVTFKDRKTGGPVIIAASNDRPGEGQGANNSASVE
jgi:microcystin degradation protein MlrC